MNGQPGRRFDEQDVELAQELARRRATAIDNARLYSDRAYIARTLQQSLLPVELPEIPGIETAARFRPAGEGNEVGGDFYDVFETGDRGWTVVMGDVCGKGAGRRGGHRARPLHAPRGRDARAAPERSPGAPERGAAPPARRPALLHGRVRLPREARPGARAASRHGGHPLPLLLRADGTRRAGRARPGRCSASCPTPTRGLRGRRWSPGDALVFYTDGVIESRATRAGCWTSAGSASSWPPAPGQGPDAIAARIEDAAVMSQNGRPRDDIAVLVLRVAE